jgi:tRNA 2-thiouridine synthesizing protein A
LTSEAIRIDARGMRCPWPALRAARGMREADHLIILADDPAAAGELQALATGSSWSFQSVEDEAGKYFVLDKRAISDLL